MGWEPVVHCRQCNEALDVYVAKEERFCSEECAEEFEKERAAEKAADWFTIAPKYRTKERLAQHFQKEKP